MFFIRLLAILPFLAIIVGVAFVNRVEPLVLGMPLVLTWLVVWIVITAGIMGIIYVCDPQNRPGENTNSASGSSHS